LTNGYRCPEATTSRAWRTPTPTSPNCRRPTTAEEWQSAMEALILVATLGGPTMFARIGVLRALNRNIERTFTGRKARNWAPRKLKRDM
jgi:hypothetical protein